MEITHGTRWQSFPSPLEQLIRIVANKTGQIFELLLYSSVYLGCAVAGMAYTCCYLQGISPSLPIIVVLAGVVFSVYNLNRKTDEAEDALNHGKRFEVTSRLEKPLFIAALLSYAIVLVIAAMSGPATVLVALIPLISGIFYSVPLLPRTWHYRRLKEIPAIKNIVVAGAWGLSFSLVPVFMTGSSPSLVTGVVFLFIFAWTVIGSVLPDIRDRDGDAATGVKTIPVILGVRETRVFLTVFNGCTAGCLLTAGLLCLPLTSCGVLLCSVVYSQACILAIGNRKTDDILVDIISDGQFLTIGAIAWLASSAVSLLILPGSVMQPPAAFL